MVSTIRRAPATVLTVAAAAVVARDVAALKLDPRAVAVVAASMATALMVALTLVSFLSWRLAGDRRSLYISAACCCYAAFPLFLGVVVPSVSPSDLSGAGTAFQIAGAPAVALFGLAARRTSNRARRRAWSVLAMLVAATGTIAAAVLALPDADLVDLEPGALDTLGARHASVTIAAVWTAVAAPTPWPRAGAPPTPGGAGR